MDKEQNELGYDKAKVNGIDMTTLLLIEDDVQIAEEVQQFLSHYHYDVITASDPNTALTLLPEKNIKCILLDIMLPGMDGLTLCRKIRETYITPIIMLSALGEETDRMIGLEMGADDYLPKPFHLRELLARIKAVLRRVSFYEDESSEQSMAKDTFSTYQFAHWRLDRYKHCLLTEDNVEVQITSGEYSILLALVSHPQRVLSRDQLTDLAYNDKIYTLERSIDIHISRLRHKIENNPKSPQIIKTIRNGGYMLSVPVEKC